MPEPNLNNPPDTSAWVAGGTAVETPPAPVEEPVAPGTEAPRPEPAAETPPAPAGQLAAPITLSPAEQVVAAMVKGGLTAADAQKLVDAVKTPQPIKDALEAMLDGKPYPVPKNLLFNLKTGTQVSQKSLDQVLREGMLFSDYQRKTGETAGLRRQLEQRIAQADAQLAAAKERETWLKEREQEMIEAQKDPAKWEQYQETMRLYQANPAFRKLYDDALSARESKAQLATLSTQAEERELQSVVEQARDWILQLSSEYPGVNPERVRVVLAYAWQNGQLPWGQEAVRSVYEGEKEYLNQGPGGQQLASLRAELDALKAAKDAEAHNAKTARAIERGKAPNTAPGGGGPEAPGRILPPKPIPPDRRAQEEAISAWSKVRE